MYIEVTDPKLKAKLDELSRDIETHKRELANLTSSLSSICMAQIAKAGGPLLVKTPSGGIASSQYDYCSETGSITVVELPKDEPKKEAPK